MKKKVDFPCVNKNPYWSLENFFFILIVAALHAWNVEKVARAYLDFIWSISNKLQIIQSSSSE